MLARPMVRTGAQFADSVGPRPMLTQHGIQTNSTAGSTQLTATNLSGGILNRTGPAGGFTDTWPNADDLIAAMDNPQKGDSWLWIYRNAVAQAMTFAAGVGIVSGIGTLSCAASSTKTYLHTVLATKRTTILVASQTNASAVLTGFTNAQIATIEPGMGASGTNIAVGSVVLGVIPSDTPNGATVTLDQNATATIAQNPVTFFPRIQVDALGIQTN